MKCPDANRVIFLIPTSQTTLDLGKCFSCNPVKVLHGGLIDANVQVLTTPGLPASDH